MKEVVLVIEDESFQHIEFGYLRDESNNILLSITFPDLVVHDVLKCEYDLQLIDLLLHNLEVGGLVL